jgi:CheY-like chemotaxis protein
MEKRAKILVVEDNQINLKLVKDILSLEKVEILEAEEGKSAIEAALTFSEEILLILLDLKLPDISGIDVIKKLKSLEKTKNIPIIAVSAHAMESDIRVTKQAGCVDYITKPINIQELISKVRNFIAE